jgi:hypothetical protein
LLEAAVLVAVANACSFLALFGGTCSRLAATAAIGGGFRFSSFPAEVLAIDAAIAAFGGSGGRGGSLWQATVDPSSSVQQAA